MAVVLGHWPFAQPLLEMDDDDYLLANLVLGRACDLRAEMSS